jgi:hypothetical protein
MYVHTEQGKQLADNAVGAAAGAVSKNKKRQYRQYMNRKGKPQHSAFILRYASNIAVRYAADVSNTACTYSVLFMFSTTVGGFNRPLQKID